MITINDVARIAGVDKSTVSMTLSNHPRAEKLHPETRERIRLIAKQLGYQKNSLAASTRTGKVNTIALILRFLGGSQPFVTTRNLDGILDQSTQCGYGIQVYTDKNLKESFDKIVGSRVKYVISMSVDEEIRKQTAILCKENGIQIVFMSTVLPGSLSVTLDYRHAIIMAVDHLFSLGHKRIGFLCSPHNNFFANIERHEGYLDGLRKHALPLYPELLDCSGTLVNPGIAMLSLPPGKRPTALVAQTDRLALGAMSAAQMLGIRIPEELSIIGFGNSSFSEMTNPPLSGIAENSFLQGALAVNLLLGNKNDMAARVENGTYYIEPEMILRKSTAPRKGKELVKK